MFLVISILLAALIALVCMSVQDTALEMHHRVLHIRYVLVTLAFVILCTLLFAEILKLINWLLSLPVINNLLYLITPTGNQHASFYWVITLLCCFVVSLIYIALMGLLHRIWLKPLSKKEYLETPKLLGKFFNALAGRFFIIQNGKAKLSSGSYNLGQWFRAMRIAFGIFLAAEVLFISLYLQFDWTFLGQEQFPVIVNTMFMLPVLMYILLEQLELFLSAERSTGKVLTDVEEIGGVQQGDFTGLAEEYKRLFGDTALIASYRGNGREKVRRSLFAGVRKDQRARAEDPALLDSLCRNVEAVSALSTQYVDGLVHLVNGDSIAVFDTPWGDFDPYYLSYLQHQLVRGSSALVLCDNPLQVQRMKQRLTAVFTKLNMVTPVWRVHDMQSALDGQTDVLICTEEEFLAKPLEKNFKDLTARLSIAVLLDAYGLLCRESSYSARIFSFFHGRNLQYVFYVPQNNADLRYQLREKMGCGEIQLLEDPAVNHETFLSFWRSDAVYKPQDILSDRLYNDFGIAYTLGIVAAKAGVDAVNILAPESVPLETYHSLVTGNYTKELSEDYLHTRGVDLSSVIRKNDHSVADPSQLKFCIVYDELNNLLDVAQTWLGYGGAASSMLHIISPPYMFRDYFAANQQTLLAQTTGQQLLIPKTPLGQKMPAISLLLRMYNGIPCQEVLQFARENRMDVDLTEDVIQNVLKIIFGENYKCDFKNSFRFNACKTPVFDGEYHYTDTVQLINKTIYADLCRLTEQFARTTGAWSEMLPIHRQDVYNHYLPGQQVSFGSKRYCITSVQEGKVELRPEETVYTEHFYTPLYDITALKRTDAPGHKAPMNNKVTIEHFEAAITRRLTGYYAHPGMLDLTDRRANTLELLPQSIEETKTVSCLQIEFSCHMPGYSDKVANTLCFLIKGALATFLPLNYKDILVFSKLDMEKVCRDVTFCKECKYLPDPIPSDYVGQTELDEEINGDICKLIPQVEGDVLANVDAVSGGEDGKLYIYIAQFSTLDTGALAAISEDLDRILSTVWKYLRWSGSQKFGAPEYLRFGYRQVPGVFSPNATAACLPHYFAQVPEKEKSEKKAAASSAAGKVCDFCGKTVVKYEQFDDGRNICAECSALVIDDRKIVREMLKDSIQILEKKYGITLPGGIKIKFKSATSIRKHTQSNGRILGFYNLKHQEIWIESKGPKPFIQSTLLHELTHAWQHANINMQIPLHFLEGHTSFVEVDCMRALKQEEFAERQHDSLMAAQDEYGEGYRYWSSVMRNEADKNIFHHMLRKFPKE